MVGAIERAMGGIMRTMGGDMEGRGAIGRAMASDWMGDGG